jgi:hypothetical protein
MLTLIQRKSSASTTIDPKKPKNITTSCAARPRAAKLDAARVFEAAG